MHAGALQDSGPTCINGIKPDVPIIAVSGTGPENLGMAEVMGAQKTLAKPVDPQALLDAVAEATAQS